MFALRIFDRHARDFVFFKQKTAYEVRISDWSSDVCSSDLLELQRQRTGALGEEGVDAFRIGLQGRLGFAGEVLEIGLGELAEAEGAEKAIEAQRRLPHHLGEAAGGGAAHEINLPQAILGMDEAERRSEGRR